MKSEDAPDGLSDGGRTLWESRAWPGMDADAAAMLLEACRAKDRLDKLDQVLRGDIDCWARLLHRVRTEDYELHIDDALLKANATAGVMSRLLNAMPAKPNGKPEGVGGEGGVLLDFKARLNANRTGTDS